MVLEYSQLNIDALVYLYVYISLESYVQNYLSKILQSNVILQFSRA